MLCRILPSVLMGLAVVVLPQIVAAEETDQGPPRPGLAAPFGRPGWAGWSEAAPPTTLQAVPAGPRVNPAVLFKRLDANADGKVTEDEIPDAAPDRLKALLKRADVNGNRQVSPDELAETIKKMRERAAGGPQEASAGRAPGAPAARPGGPLPPGPRGFAGGPWGGWPGRPDGMTGPTPPAGPRGFAGGPWGGWPGRADATTGPTPPAGRGGFARGPWGGWPGRPDAMTGPTPPPGPSGFARGPRGGWPGPWDAGVGPGRGPRRGGRGAEGRFGPPQAGPDRRPEPPYAGLRAGPPRVRVLFSRWDKDGDQKLSLEEFAAGMMSFYGTTLPARPPAADVPPGPRVRKPRPPRAGADW